MIGLGNVNNTSDLAKPISTATQSVLDLKALEFANLQELFLESINDGWLRKWIHVDANKPVST
jgi:hypothetical protein